MFYLWNHVYKQPKCNELVPSLIIILVFGINYRMTAEMDDQVKLEHCFNR